MKRGKANPEQETSSDLSVFVVGVGGGGNNSINRLSRMGVYGAQTLAVNTDKNHLENIKSDKKMLIGSSYNKGKGAGGSHGREGMCRSCIRRIP